MKCLVGGEGNLKLAKENVTLHRTIDLKIIYVIMQLYAALLAVQNCI